VSTVQLTQITDLHLGSDKSETLGGVTTFDSFQSVLRATEAQGRADNLLLLTGDLAGDCQPEAYQLLNQALVDAKKQAIWLPGNHDDVEIMKANLSDYPQRRFFEAGSWGILMLDSSKLNSPGGHFSDQELLFAEQALEQLAGKPVLVAMHHSPVLVNSEWIDKQQIENHHKLYQILEAHGGVKAVITGHVHQHNDSLWGEIPVYSTPSSCVQFEKYSVDFALSDHPPGYRWLDLHADGSLQTGVEFLKDFAQRCDQNCVGY
jgi:Icc protein